MSETKAKVQVPEKVAKHDSIYAALPAFQGELKPMAKTGHVEFPTKSGSGVVKFDYTPLGEIMATIYPFLAKHGLSVRHELTEKGIEAILTHETFSMATERTTARVIAPDGTITETQAVMRYAQNEIRSGVVKIGQAGEMKDVGAAITYARRYTLTMVLGISSEDDKDAELLEQSAKNAIQTVYDRFKAGINKAIKSEDIVKQMTVLQKDLKTIEAGKAPALGLKKEQYEELLDIGQARIDGLDVQDEKVGE